MEFRILGPLYANAGNGTGPARISQPLLQSALAVLLLRANRPCPRQWLIEALWGSEPPDQAESALRVCISRLRGSLGDCADRLHSVGPPGGSAPGHRQQRGYLMAVRPGELDVDEFADLASQGEAELELGNAAAAASSLMQALALWGDPALPDLPDTPVVSAAVTGLIGQRTAAADALIDARLAAGEHHQVVAQLRAAALADPARERTCAQLMRAYAAMGMAQEALATYQRARRAMLQEQGIEPGPVLVSLQRRILETDNATESAGKRPARLIVGRNSLPAWQAPPPPADFVGRSDELRALVDHLSGPGVPIAVLCGGPGSGKSALAAFAAAELRAKYGGGQLYAELGGIGSPRDPQDVIADVLYGLGIRPSNMPPAGPARAGLYRTITAERPVLVIADDAASPAQVRALVPPTAGSALVVTSRSRLTGVASAQLLELAGLADADAVTLLRRVAGASRVDADPAALATVLKVCAGLPLALRLAGARLAARPGLTMAALVRILTSDQGLEALAADDISMRAALAPSYRTLTAEAQAALRDVAMWVPGDIPAWTLATQDGSDISVAEEISATGLLTAAGDQSHGGHYWMHPLTRRFVTSVAPPQNAGAASPSWVAAQSSTLPPVLVGWLLRADVAITRLTAVPFMSPVPVPSGLSGSVSAGSVSAGSGAGRAWFDAERDNLRAAVDKACTVDAALAAALASRVAVTDCLRGSYGDAINSWRSVAARAHADDDSRLEAIASYFQAAVIAESHGRIWEAIDLLQRHLPILEETGEKPLAALGQCLLGRCASAYGKNALAVEALRHSERLVTDDPAYDAARCLTSAVRGLTVARMGMSSAGADSCQRAIRQARVLGEPAYEAMAIRALAQVHILDRNYSAASAMCAEGIRISRAYGSEIAAARFLILLGRTRHCDNDPATAAAPLLEAIEVFRATGSAVEEATAASLLAACRQQSGDRMQSAIHLRQVADVLERAGTRDVNLRAAVAQTACEIPAD